MRIDHPMLVLPIIMASMKAPKKMPWQEAKKWAESLDINGWSWRLPTVDEAMCIPDRSKFPAVDKIFFPDLEYEYIWTSTVNADDPLRFTWFLDTYSGIVRRYNQKYSIGVRAVCAGIPPGFIEAHRQESRGIAE